MFRELWNIGVKVKDLEREIDFLSRVGAAVVLRETLALAGRTTEYAILSLAGVRILLFPSVLFEGRVDQLRPRYLASAEILCTPCQLASFGMVLLEAMSAGVPVVASRNSGFERLMENGRQGFLIDPPDDERRFAAALDLLLEDHDLARRMGAAGRELALTTYAWPIVVDRLEELYERLLPARTGRAPAAQAAPT